MSYNILITGCSGGGKSTLLETLARAGFATIPEPGRRIVAEEMAGTGDALPWVNITKFAQRALAMARDDLARAVHLPDPVFFDRGLIDAAISLQSNGGPPLLETLGPTRAYHPLVFLAPPWPEIYQTDAERQHGLRDAIAEYDRIAQALPTLGYRPVVLPKSPVADRVSFVQDHLRAASVIS